MAEPKDSMSPKIQLLTDSEIEAVAGGVVPIVLRPNPDDYTPLGSGATIASAVAIGGFRPVDGGL